MSIRPIARILLIDDAELNNKISIYTIRKLLPTIEIVSFTEPIKGLIYIKDEYERGEIPTVLLLDINMPLLNGWEVLEILDACDPKITEHIKIHILSSSINPADQQRAVASTKVLSFLERPLTTNMVATIMNQDSND